MIRDYILARELKLDGSLTQLFHLTLSNKRDEKSFNNTVNLYNKIIEESVDFDYVFKTNIDNEVVCHIHYNDEVCDFTIDNDEIYMNVISNDPIKYLYFVRKFEVLVDNIIYNRKCTYFKTFEVVLNYDNDDGSVTFNQLKYIFEEHIIDKIPDMIFLEDIISVNDFTPYDFYTEICEKSQSFSIFNKCLYFKEYLYLHSDECEKYFVSNNDSWYVRLVVKFLAYKLDLCVREIYSKINDLYAEKLK